MGARRVLTVVVAAAVVAVVAAAALGAGPAAAAPMGRGARLVADPAIQVGSRSSGSSSGSASDYLAVLAGVVGWAVFAMWVSARHRRAGLGRFYGYASRVGDEAEEWLRDQ